jgi:hypothetical protein
VDERGDSWSATEVCRDIITWLFSLESDPSTFSDSFLHGSTSFDEVIEERELSNVVKNEGGPTDVDKSIPEISSFNLELCRWYFSRLRGDEKVELSESISESRFLFLSKGDG